MNQKPTSPTLVVGGATQGPTPAQAATRDVSAAISTLSLTLNALNMDVNFLKKQINDIGQVLMHIQQVCEARFQKLEALLPPEEHLTNGETNNNETSPPLKAA